MGDFYRNETEETKDSQLNHKEVYVDYFCFDDFLLYFLSHLFWNVHFPEKPNHYSSEYDCQQ